MNVKYKTVTCASTMIRPNVTFACPTCSWVRTLANVQEKSASGMRRLVLADPGKSAMKENAYLAQSKTVTCASTMILLSATFACPTCSWVRTLANVQEKSASGMRRLVLADPGKSAMKENAYLAQSKTVTCASTMIRLSATFACPTCSWVRTLTNVQEKSASGMRRLVLADPGKSAMKENAYLAQSKTVTCASTMIRLSATFACPTCSWVRILANVQEKSASGMRRLVLADPGKSAMKENAYLAQSKTVTCASTMIRLSATFACPTCSWVRTLANVQEKSASGMRRLVLADPGKSAMKENAYLAQSKTVTCASTMIRPNVTFACPTCSWVRTLANVQEKTVSGMRRLVLADPGKSAMKENAYLAQSKTVTCASTMIRPNVTFACPTCSWVRTLANVQEKSASGMRRLVLADPGKSAMKENAYLAQSKTVTCASTMILLSATFACPTCSWVRTLANVQEKSASGMRRLVLADPGKSAMKENAYLAQSKTVTCASTMIRLSATFACPTCSWVRTLANVQEKTVSGMRRLVLADPGKSAMKENAYLAQSKTVTCASTMIRPNVTFACPTCSWVRTLANVQEKSASGMRRLVLADPGKSAMKENAYLAQSKTVTCASTMILLSATFACPTCSWVRTLANVQEKSASGMRRLVLADPGKSAMKENAYLAQSKTVTCASTMILLSATFACPTCSWVRTLANVQEKSASGMRRLVLADPGKSAMKENAYLAQSKTVTCASTMIRPNVTFACPTCSWVRTLANVQEKSASGMRRLVLADPGKSAMKENAYLAQSKTVTCASTMILLSATFACPTCSWVRTLANVQEKSASGMRRLVLADPGKSAMKENAYLAQSKTVTCASTMIRLSATFACPTCSWVRTLANVQEKTVSGMRRLVLADPGKSAMKENAYLAQSKTVTCASTMIRPNVTFACPTCSWVRTLANVQEKSASGMRRLVLADPGKSAMKENAYLAQSKTVTCASTMILLSATFACPTCSWVRTLANVQEKSASGMRRLVLADPGKSAMKENAYLAQSKTVTCASTMIRPNVTFACPTCSWVRTLANVQEKSASGMRRLVLADPGKSAMKENAYLAQSKTVTCASTMILLSATFACPTCSWVRTLANVQEKSASGMRRLVLADPGKSAMKENAYLAQSKTVTCASTMIRPNVTFACPTCSWVRTLANVQEKSASGMRRLVLADPGKSAMKENAYLAQSKTVTCASTMILLSATFACPTCSWVRTLANVQEKSASGMRRLVLADPGKSAMKENAYLAQSKTVTCASTMIRLSATFACPTCSWVRILANVQEKSASGMRRLVLADPGKSAMKENAYLAQSKTVTCASTMIRLSATFACPTCSWVRTLANVQEKSASGMRRLVLADPGKSAMKENAYLAQSKTVTCASTMIRPNVTFACPTCSWVRTLANVQEKTVSGMRRLVLADPGKSAMKENAYLAQSKTVTCASTMIRLSATFACPTCSWVRILANVQEKSASGMRRLVLADPGKSAMKENAYLAQSKTVTCASTMIRPNVTFACPTCSWVRTLANVQEKSASGMRRLVLADPGKSAMKENAYLAQSKTVTCASTMILLSATFACPTCSWVRTLANVQEKSASGMRRLVLADPGKSAMKENAYLAQSKTVTCASTMILLSATFACPTCSWVRTLANVQEKSASGMRRLVLADPGKSAMKENAYLAQSKTVTCASTMIRLSATFACPTCSWVRILANVQEKSASGMRRLVLADPGKSAMKENAYLAQSKTVTCASTMIRLSATFACPTCSWVRTLANVQEKSASGMRRLVLADPGKSAMKENAYLAQSKTVTCASTMIRPNVTFACPTCSWVRTLANVQEKTVSGMRRLVLADPGKSAMKENAYLAQSKTVTCASTMIRPNVTFACPTCSWVRTLANVQEKSASGMRRLVLADPGKSAMKENAYLAQSKTVTCASTMILLSATFACPTCSWVRTLANVQEKSASGMRRLVLADPGKSAMKENAYLAQSKTVTCASTMIRLSATFACPTCSWVRTLANVQEKSASGMRRLVLADPGKSAMKENAYLAQSKTVTCASTMIRPNVTFACPTCSWVRTLANVQEKTVLGMRRLVLADPGKSAMKENAYLAQSKTVTCASTMILLSATFACPTCSWVRTLANVQEKSASGMRRLVLADPGKSAMKENAYLAQSKTVTCASTMIRPNVTFACPTCSWVRTLANVQEKSASGMRRLVLADPGKSAMKENAYLAQSKTVTCASTMILLSATFACPTCSWVRTLANVQEKTVSGMRRLVLADPGKSAMKENAYLAQSKTVTCASTMIRPNVTFACPTCSWVRTLANVQEKTVSGMRRLVLADPGKSAMKENAYLAQSKTVTCASTMILLSATFACPTCSWVRTLANVQEKTVLGMRRLVLADPGKSAMKENAYLAQSKTVTCASTMIRPNVTFACPTCSWVRTLANVQEKTVLGMRRLVLADPGKSAMKENAYLAQSKTVTCASTMILLSATFACPTCSWVRTLANVQEKSASGMRRLVLADPGKSAMKENAYLAQSKTVTCASTMIRPNVTFACPTCSWVRTLANVQEKSASGMRRLVLADPGKSAMKENAYLAQSKTVTCASTMILLSATFACPTCSWVRTLANVQEKSASGMRRLVLADPGKSAMKENAYLAQSKTVTCASTMILLSATFACPTCSWVRTLANVQEKTVSGMRRLVLADPGKSAMKENAYLAQSKTVTCASTMILLSAIFACPTCSWVRTLANVQEKTVLGMRRLVLADPGKSAMKENAYLAQSKTVTCASTMIRPNVTFACPTCSWVRTLANVQEKSASGMRRLVLADPGKSAMKENAYLAQSKTVTCASTMIRLSATFACPTCSWVRTLANVQEKSASGMRRLVLADPGKSAMKENAYLAQSKTVTCASTMIRPNVTFACPTCSWVRTLANVQEKSASGMRRLVLADPGKSAMKENAYLAQSKTVTCASTMILLSATFACPTCSWVRTLANVQEKTVSGMRRLVLADPGKSAMKENAYLAQSKTVTCASTMIRLSATFACPTCSWVRTLANVQEKSASGMRRLVLADPGKSAMKENAYLAQSKTVTCASTMIRPNVTFACPTCSWVRTLANVQEKSASGMRRLVLADPGKSAMKENAYLAQSKTVTFASTMIRPNVTFACPTCSWVRTLANVQEKSASGMRRLVLADPGKSAMKENAYLAQSKTVTCASTMIRLSATFACPTCSWVRTLANVQEKSASGMRRLVLADPGKSAMKENAYLAQSKTVTCASTMIRLSATFACPTCSWVRTLANVQEKSASGMRRLVLADPGKSAMKENAYLAQSKTVTCASTMIRPNVTFACPTCSWVRTLANVQEKTVLGMRRLVLADPGKSAMKENAYLAQSKTVTCASTMIRPNVTFACPTCSWVRTLANVQEKSVSGMRRLVLADQGKSAMKENAYLAQSKTVTCASTMIRPNVTFACPTCSWVRTLANVQEKSASGMRRLVLADPGKSAMKENAYLAQSKTVTCASTMIRLSATFACPTCSWVRTLANVQEKRASGMRRLVLADPGKSAMKENAYLAQSKTVTCASTMILLSATFACPTCSWVRTLANVQEKRASGMRRLVLADPGKSALKENAYLAQSKTVTCASTMILISATFACPTCSWVRTLANVQEKSASGMRRLVLADPGKSAMKENAYLAQSKTVTCASTMIRLSATFACPTCSWVRTLANVQEKSASGMRRLVLADPGKSAMKENAYLAQSKTVTCASTMIRLSATFACPTCSWVRTLANVQEKSASGMRRLVLADPGKSAMKENAYLAQSKTVTCASTMIRLSATFACPTCSWVRTLANVQEKSASGMRRLVLADPGKSAMKENAYLAQSKTVTCASTMIRLSATFACPTCSWVRTLANVQEKSASGMRRLVLADPGKSAMKENAYLAQSKTVTCASTMIRPNVTSAFLNFTFLLIL